jgi:hypothetical protein
LQYLARRSQPNNNSLPGSSSSNLLVNGSNLPVNNNNLPVNNNSNNPLARRSKH